MRERASSPGVAYRWPGLGPAADLLLCRTTKKEARKRAPPRRRLRRSPPSAGRRRVASQTRPAGSNSEATNPATAPLRSAARRGRDMAGSAAPLPAGFVLVTRLGGTKTGSDPYFVCGGMRGWAAGYDVCSYSQTLREMFSCPIATSTSGSMHRDKEPDAALQSMYGR